MSSLSLIPNDLKNKIANDLLAISPQSLGNYGITCKKIYEIVSKILNTKVELGVKLGKVVLPIIAIIRPLYNTLRESKEELATLQKVLELINQTSKELEQADVKYQKTLDEMKNGHPSELQLEAYCRTLESQQYVIYEKQALYNNLKEIFPNIDSDIDKINNKINNSLKVTPSIINGVISQLNK